LGPRTQIGKNCEIKANTVIGGEGFGFAHDQKGHHHRIPQKGRVVLEDNVYIGSMCAVDRATLENGETRIGEGTKLDNHIQIAHNVKIGKHCVFAGGTVIAGSTTIGNHCVVGGHSSIAGHIKICDQVHLGGRSGVSGSIEKPGAYTGHPLQPLKDHLRSEAYIKRLPALGKAVQIILKKIGLEDSI
jgi:UDP-3-O-[3-hydroxymyristoyl] glucosamine N-acyltransferase